MQKLIVFGSLLLISCSNPYNLQKTPFSYAIDGYPVWRQCRVDYEFANKLPYPPEYEDLLLTNEQKDMKNDARLFGPKMDHAVDTCMSQHGYAKLANR